MKIKNHIAYKFLTDPGMTRAIINQLCPVPESEEDALRQVATMNLISPKDQTTYYVTDTVMQHLEHLKIKTLLDGSPDWGVFAGRIPDGKATYILPGNRVVRVMAYAGTRLGFCLVIGEPTRWRFTTAFLDRKDGTRSWNWSKSKDIAEAENTIYKLLCFIYMSENEFQQVEAGRKAGTRRSGKVINELPFRVIVVTSKWNVTYVNASDFKVSGHFRLWLRKATGKYELIFVKPYTKHGYTRKAHTT